MVLTVAAPAARGACRQSGERTERPSAQRGPGPAGLFRRGRNGRPSFWRCKKSCPTSEGYLTARFPRKRPRRVRCASAHLVGARRRSARRCRADPSTSRGTRGSGATRRASAGRWAARRPAAAPGVFASRFPSAMSCRTTLLLVGRARLPSPAARSHHPDRPLAKAHDAIPRPRNRHPGDPRGWGLDFLCVAARGYGGSLLRYRHTSFDTCKPRGACSHPWK
jgi:hypothetical protein